MIDYDESEAELSVCCNGEIEDDICMECLEYALSNKEHYENHLRDKADLEQEEGKLNA